MIVKLSSLSHAWKLTKYISANRVTINAAKPLSGSAEVLPQRPWVQMEQSPDQAAHSSLVGNTMRCLHALKEAGKLNNVAFEPHYGKPERGGYIIFKSGTYEEKAVTIKNGEVQWQEAVLTHVGLAKSTIDEELTKM